MLNINMSASIPFSIESKTLSVIMIRMEAEASMILWGKHKNIMCMSFGDSYGMIFTLCLR